MATSKNRQRALARAKVERQNARRAAQARRRRQRQGIVGAVLVVALAVGLTGWLTGGWDKLWDSFKNPPVVDDCTWLQAENANLTDVGKPPTTGIPKSGTATMTITTNQGVIEAQLDLAKAPCTAASFSYLAGKQFFDNGKCHRLTTEGIFVLQCGDPAGNGTGGPTYKFADENLPTPQPAAPDASPGAADPDINLYPRGTLAMANSGPGTNGSQFFIVYKDHSGLEGNYTIFGKVTKGLDIVEKIAAGGVADANGQPATDGAPKTEVVIESLTVSAPVDAPPTPAPAQPQPSDSDAPTNAPASPQNT